MKRSITLFEPVKIGGKLFSTIDIRRATMGDEEDAVEDSITLGKEGNQLTIEMSLIGRLIGVAYDDMRSMPPAVYKQIRGVYAEMSLPNGGAAAPDPETSGGSKSEEAPAKPAQQKTA